MTFPYGPYQHREIPVKSAAVAKRRLGLAAFAGFLISAVSGAQSSSVSGRWDASPLQVSWAIGTWGESCGAQPGGGGDGGGVVTLSASGSDFTWSGLRRSYSSTSCWEQMPGLQVRSHSASATTIQTTCEMPKGDPRQAKLVTTWALRGDKIYFDETAQYQFVSKDGPCTASARRTRLLSRAAPAPTASPEKSEQAASDAPVAADQKAPTTPSSCTGDEKPSTLTLTPRASVLRSGDLLEFDLSVRGARGCPVKEKAHVEFIEGRDLLEEGDSSAFRVRADAGSGRVVLRARAGALETTQTVLVVSNRELQNLLGDAPELDPAEALDPARTEARTSTDAADEKDAGNAALLATLFAALLTCGGILYWFRRRPERSAPSAPPAEKPSEKPPTAEPTPAEGAPRPHPPTVRPKGRLCPVCGERYPLESVFCGKDGARLVREN